MEGEEQRGKVVTSQVKSQGGPIERGPHALDGDRDWSTELFACTEDSKVCWCGLCNPCYSCMISKRMGENTLLPCCVGTLTLRSKLRYSLGIRGDLCDDCVMVGCCQPCVMCQMVRELNNAGWPAD